MKCNIGKTDKGIRIALGGLLLVFGGWYQNWITILLGAIISITAIISFCPLYPLIGISTHRKK